MSSIVSSSSSSPTQCESGGGGGIDVEAIIFDLDGTLIDFEGASHEALNAPLAAHGRAGGLTWALHGRIVGRKGEDWSRIVLEVMSMECHMKTECQNGTQWRERSRTPCSRSANARTHSDSFSTQTAERDFQNTHAWHHPSRVCGRPEHTAASRRRGAPRRAFEVWFVAPLRST